MHGQPRARSHDLTVEVLGDELLVFDTTRNRAHSLNATATRVWRACDGRRNTAQLAVVCELDADTVELALERLEACRLLETDRPQLDGQASKVNRRAVLRRAALTGAGLGAALPIIRSITAPTPAHAQSSLCSGGGDPCNALLPCCSSSVSVYTCRGNNACYVGSCRSSGQDCSYDYQCCFGLTCQAFYCAD